MCPRALCGHTRTRNELNKITAVISNFLFTSPTKHIASTTAPAVIPMPLTTSRCIVPKIIVASSSRYSACPYAVATR